MDASTPGRVLLAIMAGLMILMIVIPLIYPYGSFTGLDGKAGIFDNTAKLAFADPVSRAVYGLGDLFCHQDEARSFIINGSQMAFCQRDVSIAAGLIVGLIITDKRITHFYLGDRNVLIIGLILIASTILEWSLEYSLSEDLLATRVLTGVLAGIGAALVFQYAVTRQYENAMGVG